MSVLSAVLVLTMLPLNGLLGFLTADAASNDLVLSLNVIEETDSEVSLAIRLEKGKFNALDLTLKKETDKIGKCTSALESDDLLMFIIRDIKKLGGTGSSAINAENGCFSIAMTIAYDKVGTDILEYTFVKNSPDTITCEDFSVEITSCAAGNLGLNPSVICNLPEPTVVHTHNYTATVTAPSCTAQGYTTYTCSCGDSFVSDYVQATGHSFGSWKVTKAATETATGTKEHKCSKCGAVETEIIPKLQHTHSYSLTKTVNATCTKNGSKTYTCSCGDSYMETIPATGHSFGAWTVTKAATTTAEGLKERKCSKCGAVETEVIPKLAAAVICRASLDNQGADSAGTIILWYKYNTVENGVYYYYDSACARPFAGTKIVCPTKSGYTFGGYFTGKNGTGTQYVSADGSVKDVYKTSDSKTLYAYWIVNHVHSYTSKITKAATCTEAGVKTFTCTCGDSYTETIPAKGHSYTSKVTAPTCTAQGYTTSTCSCGDSYVSDYVPATGHSFGEWTVTKAATTTAEGLKERKCSKCGAVETEVIPKLEPQQESKVMLNNHDISLRYKASSKLIASSENVEWSSSNTKVAVVDRNGNVKATGIGTAIITVTDTETNMTDECRFTVSYDWWQWIIVIVLFGWIWY